MLERLIKKISVSKYTLLYIAIILVGSLQLMAGRAEMIGQDVHTIIPRYAQWEVYGGLGVAILEAIVVSAFLAPAWMKLPKRTTYWWVLGGLILLILFSIPLFSAPAMMAVQFGEPVRNVLNWQHFQQYPAVWVWTFFGTSIVSLMALALGLSRDVMEQRRSLVADIATIKRGNPDALPSDIAKETGAEEREISREYAQLVEAFSTNGKQK